MTGTAVSLMEMLMARESRVFRQQELLAQYGKTLLCFTMNIAGPIKDNPLIRWGFTYGQILLRQQLRATGIVCLHEEESHANTGSVCYLVLDATAERVKAETTALEESLPLGRLFDMDVLDCHGVKLERTQFGLPSRSCLVCGQAGASCASRRLHSVEELQVKTEELLRQTLRAWEAETVGELAVRSLLFEVATTPKPGLVDCENSGSHRDMDIFTFLASSASLSSYFVECVRIGQETAEPAEAFVRLRQAGKQAEGRMYRATNGVNTHKGAIFSLGLLCGAVGRCGWTSWDAPERLLRECATLTAGLSQRDMQTVTAETAQTTGQRLYASYGLTGVRGQAEAGFPAVENIGLPTLTAGLAQGLSLNEAGCGTLLALLSGTVDTNLIARSDYPTQQRVAQSIAELCQTTPFPERTVLQELNEQFVAQNLSPGGSADLLALTYFLHFLQTTKGAFQ